MKQILSAMQSAWNQWSDVQYEPPEYLALCLDSFEFSDQYWSVFSEI